MINSKTNKIVFFVVGLLLMYSCSNPTAFFTESEQKTWKNDQDGCKNERFAILSKYESQLETLKGSSEMEIKRIFGASDYTSIDKRNEKFYIYFLEPSKKCADKSFGMKKVLSVRFNAINQANEIIITNK